MMKSSLSLKEHLIHDTEDLQKRIIECFRPLNPDRIILFGSAGRGEMDQHSDVDIIIIQKTNKRFLDRLEDAYLCWKLPFAVDILVYTPDEFKVMMDQENAFLCEAVAHGKVAYERCDQ